MRATLKPQPDGTPVKALARAWRWQKLLDEGVSEIGAAENVSKSYVSRILRLLRRTSLAGRPLRKTPLTTTRKWRSGLTMVSS